MPVKIRWKNRNVGGAKTKPRARSARGMNPSSSKTIIVRFWGEVNITFEEVPRPRPPRHFPYQNRESGGPDGIRTRTLEHDGFMCCRLHHGPCFDLTDS